MVFNLGTWTDKETNSRVEWNFIHKTIIIITNFMTGNNTNRNDDDLENWNTKLPWIQGHLYNPIPWRRITGRRGACR